MRWNRVVLATRQCGSDSDCSGIARLVAGCFLNDGPDHFRGEAIPQCPTSFVVGSE